MIRIKRGDEPASLGQKRDHGLQRIRESLAEDPSQKLHFPGYQEAAEPLWEAQGKKCCYCKKELYERPYNDTEHYRPKGHYWWLAWTWENLLFACPI